jgi:hypothetical protein
VTEDRERTLAYARKTLLPIWERWTNADPALGHALDLAETGSDGAGEALQELAVAARRLLGRLGEAESAAPYYAATTVIQVLEGSAADLIVSTAFQAIAANSRAEERRTGQAGPDDT